MCFIKYSFTLYYTTFCSPFLLQSNRTCYLPLQLPSGANGGCKHEVEVDGIAEVVVRDWWLHVVLSERLPHVVFAHAINLMASKTAWSMLKRTASASNVMEKHQQNDSLKVQSQCHNHITQKYQFDEYTKRLVPQKEREKSNLLSSLQLFLTNHFQFF